MPKLSAIDTPPDAYVASDAYTSSKSLLNGLDVGKKLGKGKFNCVCEVKCNGEKYVLRMPRRKSDTEDHATAAWECMTTLRAGTLGAGPLVYAAWYLKHKTGRFALVCTSMERMDATWKSLCPTSSRRFVAAKRVQIVDDVARGVATALTKLAGDFMSCMTSSRKCDALRLQVRTFV